MSASQAQVPFADLISALPTLYELDVHGQFIGAEGVVQLATALERCVHPRLTSLNLSNCYIGDEGAKRICTAAVPSMRVLNLSWNRLSREGLSLLKHLLQSCTALSMLDLECNDLADAGSETLAAALQSCRSLRVIRLGGNRIGVSGAEKLAAVLPGCGVEALDVSRNYLGERGSSAFVKVRGCAFQRLNLSYNRVRDSGTIVMASALDGTCSLDFLDLSGNHIGDEGAKALADALRTNDLSLSTLRLCYNSISVTGAEALTEVVEKGLNRRIQFLDLAGNIHVCNDALAKLQQALSRNSRSLVLYDPLQAALGMCAAGAYELNLWGIFLGSRDRERLLNALVGYRVRISTLGLGNTDLGDEGAQQVGATLARRQSLKLEEIDLSWNKIQLVGSQGIADMLRMQHIRVNLKKLNLSCNNLKDEGISFLAASLLGRASGSRSEAASDSKVALQELQLVSNGIGHRGAASIAAVLEAAEIELTDLDLSQNVLGAAGAKHLAASLLKSRSLARLGLAVNRLGDDGATSLATVLMQRAARRPRLELNLKSNRFGDASVDAWIAALRAGAGSVTLKWDYNNLSAKMTTALEDTLRQIAEESASELGSSSEALEVTSVQRQRCS